MSEKVLSEDHRAGIPRRGDTRFLSSQRIHLRALADRDKHFLYQLMISPQAGGRVRFGGATPSPEKVASSLWESVLAQFRIRVARGEHIARIPVRDAFVPGAHVFVMLVDSGAIGQKDSVHHRFRAGYSTITVSRATKTLTVGVRPDRPRYFPGDSARVTVNVRDHRSQPVAARVVLWAVTRMFGFDD